MSTKTITKRVALATVVALGAGVLSLVTVSSASATTSNYAPTAVTGTQGLVTGITGAGLVSPFADISGTTNQMSGTLLSTGSLTFTIDADTNTPVALTTGYQYGTYVVSSGAYVSASASANAKISTDQTTAYGYNSANTGTTTTNFTITPTGAAGSTFTVTNYKDSTKAVALQVFVVTIAGASVSGVVSPAKSVVAWSGTATHGQALTSDVSTGSATTTGLPLYLQVALNDAYGAGLTSTTGALTVTATTGANVSIGAAAGNAAASGTYSTAVSNAAAADLVVKVTEATPGAGWSGTVTVTYNGVVVATKSGTITGLPAKITIAALSVAKTNATTDTAVSYQVYDAAGNAVALAPSAISLTSSSNTSSVTGIATGTYVNGNSTTSAGSLAIVGGTTAGTSNVVVQTTTSTGATITSNSAAVLVGGSAYSYTASLDKTKYAPGDIATLKIKFLDSKGNPAASSSSIYTTGAAAPFAWNASLTLPQLAQIGTAGVLATGTTSATYGVGSNVAPDATGTITLKWTVGSTEASYSGVVDFPTVDGVAGSAQTVSYSVSSGSTSLNDVLKGIVSLIASINKQIAALAKLVTKK